MDGFRLGVVLLTSLIAVPSVAEKTQISGNPSLDWLAGRWCLDSGNRHFEEVWLADVGGQMLGMARTVKGGKVVGFEYLRIETDAGSTRYIAQPGGAPPTIFIASEVSENLLVVENPEHDFPQKIAYRREGDALMAAISGLGDDGQEQSIKFSYQSCQD